MPLLHLPREIRDDIFINVLRSHTRHINISLGQNATGATFSLLEVLPSTEDVKGQITLPVLSVNKQIHSECKDLLWKLETQHFLLLPRLPFLRLEMSRHQARCQNSTRPARDGPTQPRKVERDSSFEAWVLGKI
jgi:hypothetical protein